MLNRVVFNCPPRVFPFIAAFEFLSHPGGITREPLTSSAQFTGEFIALIYTIALNWFLSPLEDNIN